MRGGPDHASRAPEPHAVALASLRGLHIDVSWIDPCSDNDWPPFLGFHETLREGRQGTTRLYLLTLSRKSPCLVRRAHEELVPMVIAGRGPSQRAAEAVVVHGRGGLDAAGAGPLLMRCRLRLSRRANPFIEASDM